MTDLLDLVPQAAAPPNAVAGYITAVDGVDVYAILPTFDITHRYGPLHGAPVSAGIGDACLVVFDESGEPWYVAPAIGGGGGDVDVNATANATTLAPGANATVAVTEPSANLFDFAFGIPRGNAGAPGAAGAQGPQGPTGPTGPAGAPAGTVTIAAWTPITGFANNWTAYPGYPPSYRKRPDGIVELRGLVRNGNNGQDCWGAVLPTDCRPDSTVELYFTTMAQGPGSTFFHHDCYMRPDGSLRSLYTGWGAQQSGYFSLDGIRYSTAQTSYPAGPQGPPGPASTPPLVSALPGSPVDGQEVYFQTAAMATANVSPWHLRYRAAITDAFKWEAIGPHALRSTFNGQQDASTASYADVPATSIAVPIGGYYTHQATIYAYNNTAGGYGVANVKYGTTSEADAHEIIITTQNPLTVGGQAFAPVSVPASGVIVGRWRMSTAGIARLYRFLLAVTPSRVG